MGSREGIDRIMAVVKEHYSNLCHPHHEEAQAELRDKISSILSSPEVVVVEGVEWVPQLPVEYQHFDGDNLWRVKAHDDFWMVGKNNVVLQRWSDCGHALSAATAAIKASK